MKLSEVERYQELLSAHLRSEISNEEVQKIMIADGRILSNLYQEIEMDSSMVDCMMIQITSGTRYSSTAIHSMSFYTAAAGMYSICWEPTDTGCGGEILSLSLPASATVPCIWTA